MLNYTTKDYVINILKQKRIYDSIGKFLNDCLMSSFESWSVEAETLDDYIEEAVNVLNYHYEYDGQEYKPNINDVVGFTGNKNITNIIAYVLHQTGAVEQSVYKHVRRKFTQATSHNDALRSYTETYIDVLKSIVESNQEQMKIENTSLDDIIPFLEKINKKHKEEVVSYKKRCKELESALEEQKKLTLMYQMNEKACMDKAMELSNKLKAIQEEKSVFPIHATNESSDVPPYISLICDIYSLVVKKEHEFDMMVNNEKELIELLESIYVTIYGEESDINIKYDKIIDYIAKHDDTKHAIVHMLEAMLPNELQDNIYNDIKERKQELEGGKDSHSKVENHFHRDVNLYESTLNGDVRKEQRV